MQNKKCFDKNKKPKRSIIKQLFKESCQKKKGNKMHT